MLLVCEVFCIRWGRGGDGKYAVFCWKLDVPRGSSGEVFVRPLTESIVERDGGEGDRRWDNRESGDALRRASTLIMFGVLQSVQC